MHGFKTKIGKKGMRACGHEGVRGKGVIVV
jgi:hypothetical protein